MKKLLLVDVPDGYKIVKNTLLTCNMQPSFARRFKDIEFTELDPLTPEEINYFLTLHNHNEQGIIYSPIPDGLRGRLEGMR